MPNAADGQGANSSGHRHTNRLAAETSPYLLQHAHNPVDWHAWGPQAWQRAKEEDKPVLVSIGYAACHWCHVMERESFEDEAVARRQNELFISIKVDREERPDVDDVYMEALQLMQGQGGWPLNVFCLPDGRPFFGGTYFPPVRRGGMTSWREVLDGVAEAYRERRDQAAERAQQLVDHMGRRPAADDDEALPGPAAMLSSAAQSIMNNHDHRRGGYGSAPKFPQPYYLRLLLQHADANGDAAAREQVLFTLRQMAEGGMYDQLAGGFHRYSVDAEWLVPHFEKMLYDNALLPPLYLDAARLSGDPFFARIAEETLDYLLRDMRSDEGAFFSSTDADSEGVEGKYFVWSLQEVRELLGESDAAVFSRYYDVTAQGNFEGDSILHPLLALSELAAATERGEDDVAAILERGRETLLRVRGNRVPPATDTKVIVAWNGLVIDALAQAGAVLAAPRFVAAAERAAEFILATLRRDGGLLRIYAGGRASVAAFLDDYAALADGLLSLYEVTGNERWFAAAQELVDEMIAKFWDDDAGGFFTAGSDNEALVTRSKPTFDSATPSGNSLAAKAMVRLYALNSDGALADRIESMDRAFAGQLVGGPSMMALFVVTRDWLQRHQTVVIVGERDAAGTADLLRAVWEGPPRNAIVALRQPGADTGVPQLRDKDAQSGRATAYVCRGYTCSAPVTAAEELSALLRAGTIG